MKKIIVSSILLMFTTIGTFASTPILHYTLDGDSFDISGNSYNGTDINVTYPIGTINNYNSYASLTGNSSYINTGFSSLGFPLSLSVWIRTTEQFTTNLGFFSSVAEKGTHDPIISLYGEVNTGRAGFQIRDNSGSNYSIQSTTVINDGNWHHVVGVASETEMKIYIDGVLEGSTFPNYLNVNISGYPFYLGVANLRGSPASDFLLGELSDARVYGEILDANTVGNNFETPTVTGDYCFTKPIKESILKESTTVIRNALNSITSYQFQNDNVAAMTINIEDGLDDFTESNIVTQLGLRGFDTSFTFDRDISVELPTITGTYEIFLGVQTNIRKAVGGLSEYNYDFDLGKFTLPGDIGTFNLESSALLAPYSETFIVFKNSNQGTKKCFSTDDDILKLQFDEIIYQRDNNIISTDDAVYQIERLLEDSNITPETGETEEFVSNNVISTVNGSGIFDFFLNPLREVIDSTAFGFITDLLLLNELPSSTSDSVTFNLAVPRIQSDWTFSLYSFPVELEFISDKLGLSNIERNEGVTKFFTFCLSILYITGKLAFIFFLISPIFLLLFVFNKFSRIFDFSKHTNGNIASIPFYLTYIGALLITIGALTALIGNFYDFIIIVFSYFSYIFIWLTGSLGQYDFFRAIILVFYAGIGGTSTTFLLYRGLKQFGKVN